MEKGEARMTPELQGRLINILLVVVLCIALVILHRIYPHPMMAMLSSLQLLLQNKDLELRTAAGRVNLGLLTLLLILFLFIIFEMGLESVLLQRESVIASCVVYTLLALTFSFTGLQSLRWVIESERAKQMDERRRKLEEERLNYTHTRTS
jgi:cobalamin biosynthesis protein CobD/CbiB